jgi:rod shape-determining protein MreC
MRFTAPVRPYLTPVEAMLREAVAPLQNGVTFITNKITGLGDYVISQQQLLEQTKTLKAEVNRLSAVIHQLEEYRLENIRLKELLNFAERNQDQYQLLAARVIGRDTKNVFSTLTLDVGTRQGVKPNLAVITHQGLVGRVVAVTANTAEVMTLLDLESSAGALLQDSRFPGVVEAIPGNTSHLQMIHLPHDAPVSPNQVVITSGMSVLFPKGLRIGYVVDTVTEPSGLMQKAILQPFVDFDRLEEVLVLLTVEGSG